MKKKDNTIIEMQASYDFLKNTITITITSTMLVIQAYEVFANLAQQMKSATPEKAGSHACKKSIMKLAADAIVDALAEHKYFMINEAESERGL